VDFKLYTSALKAYTAENGDLYVRGTTSSTIRDLHGDEMTLSALKSMEETAKKNMTVFLNHNYNVPDDLFGSVTDARIVKRLDRETEQEVYDLDIDVRVVGEDENPLAMKTYRAIKRGVKLGLSIGAKVDKVSKKKGADGEDTYVIESVKLLETSVVGIPANQRSYLQSALKSIRQSEKSDEDEIAEDYFDNSLDKADAPAPASDQRVGSDRNPPGSASGQGGRISLSSATRKALQNKANEHNAAMKEDDRPSWTRVRVGALRSVYRRGSGAYSTSHRPGVSRAAWSMARVNAFLVLARRGKPANPKYTSDNDLLNPGHPRYSGKKSEIKAAAGQLEVGDYVNWNIGSQKGYGEVDEIVIAGTVSLPGSDMPIDASPEEPVAIICVYAPQGEDWEETGVYVAVKFSALTRSNPPVEAEEDEETEMSETEKDLVAEEVVETATADEVVDAEKKTRVTVTVSTEGEKPAAEPAAPADVAEKTEEEDAPEAIQASVATEEIVEKAVEPAPAPAPTPTPAPAPEPAPAPKPAEEPKAPVADGEKSSRYKSGVSAEVLNGINGILADLTDEDREAVLAGLGVQKDGEPVVEEAPISDSEVTLEVVQEAPAEVAAKASSDVVAEDVAATSLEEVAAIAKSALDAAIAAQQEVVAVKSVVTELSAEKAKVEGELARALDLVGRMINVPMGRKQVAINSEKSTNGEKAPWLDPFIARLLDAQE